MFSSLLAFSLLPILSILPGPIEPYGTLLPSYDCPDCDPFCGCDLEVDPDSWECAGLQCSKGNLDGYTWEEGMCGCYSIQCEEGTHYESYALGCVADGCTTRACACFTDPSLPACEEGFCIDHPDQCETPTPEPTPDCTVCSQHLDATSCTGVNGCFAPMPCVWSDDVGCYSYGASRLMEIFGNIGPDH